MPRFSHLTLGDTVKLLLRVTLLFSAPLLFGSGHCMSAKERSKVFDQVWRLVGEKYYDPNFNGVNWSAIRDQYRPRAQSAKCDDELYAVLKEMSGSLHDAHTRFRSPAERERARRLQATTPGLSINEVDGRPVIVNVEAHSEASRAGLEAGMVITSVDGTAFVKRVSEVGEEVGDSSSARARLLLTYYEVLAGEPGTKVRLGVERQDGSTLEVELPRHTVPIAPPLASRVLPSGYGYIKVDMFRDAVAKQFREELAKFRSTPGLIIDVRGNPGGDFDGVLGIANNFFAQKVSFGRIIARSGKAPSLMLRILGVPSELAAGDSSGSVYTGPVIILVNEASGSAAEIFAAGMQENHRAAIVGRQTCGCVLASVAHSVKGGGEVDISEFGIVTASGRRLEGVGVIPDVTVPLKLEDLRQHHDAALREAVAVLNSSNRVASQAETQR
ncbi:MAG TPA: S41 family peptidase [Terriglobales bacterium]